LRKTHLVYKKIRIMQKWDELVCCLVCLAMSPQPLPMRVL
jgi:hypothetical protein